MTAEIQIYMLSGIDSVNNKSQMSFRPGNFWRPHRNCLDFLRFFVMHLLFLKCNELFLLFIFPYLSAGIAARANNAYKKTPL